MRLPARRPVSSRRLTAACLAVACILPTACTGGEQPADQAPDPSAILAYSEIKTGSASNRGVSATPPISEVLPLVIAIHGLGDKPESFSAFYQGLTARARVVLPAGPEPWGQGYSWFSLGARDSHTDRGGGSIRDAVERLVHFISAVRAAEPARGKTIVTGFSQGGILSFSLAALHPELVGTALPISGMLTDDLRAYATDHASELPKLIAFHGNADPLIHVATTRLAIQALRKAGAVVEFHGYDGVGHHISPQMRNDYFVALTAAVEATATHAVDDHTTTP